MIMFDMDAHDACLEACSSMVKKNPEFAARVRETRSTAGTDEYREWVKDYWALDRIASAIICSEKHWITPEDEVRFERIMAVA